jgi:site-specific DNA recombinase
MSEIKRRREIGTIYSGKTIFSSKLICGECGCYYGSKVWHSNDAYRKTVWQCNGKYRKKTRCTTPYLSEDQIKEAFVKAYNKLVSKSDSLIEDITELKAIRCNTTAMEKRLDKLNAEIDLIVKQTEDLVEENARKVQDQKAYQTKYDELVAKYEEKNKKRDALEEKIESSVGVKNMPKLTKYVLEI